MSKQERFFKFKQIFLGKNPNFVLNDLLCQNLSGAHISERMYWMEQILHWLFQTDADGVDVRFRFFLTMMEKNVEWRENFLANFLVLLERCQFLGLFTNIGIAIDHGLWGDVVDRILEKIIPAGGSLDFQKILHQTFSQADRVEQIDRLSPETLERLRVLLIDPRLEVAWKKIHIQSQNALSILAAHVTHYGLSEEVRELMPMSEDISRLSFFKLSRDPSEETLDLCESDIVRVYANMDEGGVSVDVVNRLETARALIQRIRIILRMNQGLEKSERIMAIRNFVRTIAESSHERKSVWGTIRLHFYLLSKKIVERNGSSADHYIGRNRTEFIGIFRSSIGGGAVVLLMTLAKIKFLHWELPPFLQALGIWIIYSTGFLTMQFTGATLATKIPSFTASKLANLLKNVQRSEAEGFYREFRLVLKSQALALLGNVASLIPLVVATGHIFRLLFNGINVVDQSYALHIVNDLHPLFSFVIPLGALTGIQLWLSSVAGGWFDNWIVYKKLPQAIENHHRLRTILGEKRVQSVSHWLQHHASGIAGNLSLGFLFGFIPLLGQLFGLNWNGHHITISTASAVFALDTFSFTLTPGQWISVISGLILIGAMNFGVSFGLALYIAANAQKMKMRRVLKYLLASLRKA